MDDQKKYHTDHFILNRDGTTTTEPTLEELLDSPHPEIRRLARTGCAFKFGGTVFAPHVELPQYSGKLKLFEHGGAKPLVPPRGEGMSPAQVQAVQDSVSARRLVDAVRAPERSPTPKHLMVVPIEPQTTAAPAAARAWPLAAVVALYASLFVFSASLGWAAALRLAPPLLNQPGIARPACDRATGICR